MKIEALDHVQLAMPAGGEAARARLLCRSPRHSRAAEAAALAARGGCWFERGALKVHLGVEADFRPARKAHPAFLVSDLAALVAALEAAGHPTRNDEPLPGYERVYVDDPFGNRLELLEPSRG